MNEDECNEREYAARWLRILNTGLGRLDQDVAEALASARRSALERGGRGGGRHPALAVVYDFRFGMAAAALAVMAFTMRGPSQQPSVQEVGQLDIQLLTGELPPRAFIDKDFPAWRRLPGLCRS